MVESAAGKMGMAGPAFMPAGAGGLGRRERRMRSAAAAEAAERFIAGAGSFIAGAKAAANDFFGSQIYLYYCLCGWSSNNTCRNAAGKYLSFTSPLPENSIAAAAAPAPARGFLQLSAAKACFAAFAAAFCPAPLPSPSAFRLFAGAGSAFPVMGLRRKPAAGASGKSPGKGDSTARISWPLRRFGGAKIKLRSAAAIEFAVSLLPQRLKYRRNSIQ